MSRKLTYTSKWQTVNYVPWLYNSGCFPCSHRKNNFKKNVTAFPSLCHFKTPIWWHKCCLTRTPIYFFIYCTSVKQCFQSSAFLRKSAIFVLPGNFCTWFSNFRKKNPQKNFFSFFFSVKKKTNKKLFRVTIFRKQNGGWTHLCKKNKKFFRRKWRPSSSAQGEQEKWQSNSSRAQGG